APGKGELRIEPQRLIKALQGGDIFSCLDTHIAHAVIGIRVVGRLSERLLDARDGFLIVPLRLPVVALAVPGFGVVAILLEDEVIRLERVIILFEIVWVDALPINASLFSGSRPSACSNRPSASSRRP